MMSAENTIPDKVSGTYSECVECHQPADSAKTLTWVMLREDVELRNMADVKAFLERSEGRPYIMVLPEDEEIKVYSVAWYCDDCLDRYLDVYEKRHTSSDKVTKADLQERVLQLARDTDWLIYVRDLSHMVPRGFPDLALIREDEVIFPTLRGDVSMRLRSLGKGHISSHSLLISPAVPQEVWDTFLHTSGEKPIPHTVTFLYMDEKYIDTQFPPEMQITSLTGLLIPADTYPLFRDRLFGLLPYFNEGVGAASREVHASNLFPDLTDQERFAFLNGLVSLVNELDCRVYRRGFNFIPGHKLLRSKQQELLGICFKSILIDIAEHEDDAQIWPVMEIDHSEVQDRNFAGYIRWMDHATAHLHMTGDGVEELIDDDYMVDNKRIGDLHYVSKRSIVGSAVDCLVYLLNCKWLRDKRFQLTEYKNSLAKIASGIHPSLVSDFVVSYRVDQTRVSSTQVSNEPEDKIAPNDTKQVR